MNEIQNAAALLGKKGGEAGTGKRKTRSAEFYKRLSAMGTAAFMKNRGTIEQRFWSKVNKNGPVPEHVPALGPCWVWTGCVTPKGYGMLGVDQTKWLAHRFSWKMHHGEIGASVKILHRCDNGACVRPSHLFKGTCQDNSDDMIFKGRAKYRRGEQTGTAKLTEADVLVIRKEAKEGNATNLQLAKQFGVSSCAISNVRTRKKWRHVV